MRNLRTFLNYIIPLTCVFASWACAWRKVAGAFGMTEFVLFVAWCAWLGKRCFLTRIVIGGLAGGLLFASTAGVCYIRAVLHPQPNTLDFGPVITIAAFALWGLWHGMQVGLVVAVARLIAEHIRRRWAEQQAEMAAIDPD